MKNLENEERERGRTKEGGELNTRKKFTAHVE